MTYSYLELAATAPPGWRRHRLADVDALAEDELAIVPASDLAAARAGDGAAEERVLKALFWPLVYSLEPHLWDRLAAAEPIHPGVVEALAVDGRRVLEVAAGSGRLSVHLALRAAELICVEPAPILRGMLARRVPAADVRDGVAQALPVADAWADVGVACASLGPDLDALAELERCTAPGGVVALVSPQRPEWFTAHGWELVSFPASDVAARADPELEAIFGPLDPPHQLVRKPR